MSTGELYKLVVWIKAIFVVGAIIILVLACYGLYSLVGGIL